MYFENNLNFNKQFYILLFVWKISCTTLTKGLQTLSNNGN